MPFDPRLHYDEAEADASECLARAEHRTKNIWGGAQRSDRCEALFGNGFHPFIQLCTPQQQPEASSFECTSNSVGGSTICSATNILVDVSKIQVSEGSR